MITLENDQLRVRIRPQGAELTSLFHKPTGTEHLWQADPAVWGWHAPNLFPVVGGCLNDQLQIDGQTYPMQRHGFARHSVFELALRAADRAVFELQATEETRAVYPYKFRFQIDYLIRGSQLAISYRVVNEDDKPVFFSIGAHPAFSVPFGKDERYEDYYLEFEDEKPLKTHRLSARGLFTGESEPVVLDGNRLFLSGHLFDRDALVFKNLRSQRVSLCSRHHNQAVTVGYQGFPYLGIWAKPGAAFVCIEPWLGCADSEVQQWIFAKKKRFSRLG